MKDSVKVVIRSIAGAAFLGALATAGAHTVAGPAHPAEKHEWDYGKEHGPTRRAAPRRVGCAGATRRNWMGQGSRPRQNAYLTLAGARSGYCTL